MTVPRAAGRVLPTLNEDGSRHWIRPRPSTGAWWTRRRFVGYSLIAFFVALPHLRWMGKPLILLDVPRREFTLLGNTFLPTDTLILMLLLGSAVIAIFLFSALFGRVWCGWGCPQTVYMEFVFRPIERLLEGGRSGSLAMDKANGVMSPRRILKYLIYIPICLVLAHTFLAYFVGTDTLQQWVQLSPYEHPTPFLVMAVTTLLIFIDFGWFREQTCLIACPYGRWQAALIDKRSLIVAYDAVRGEPRRAGSNREHAGDCVSCNACVVTCPTGIDIRNGLQMDCLACTACIDACDEIMDRLHRPRGLIRYDSQAGLAGEPRRFFRPRIAGYAVLGVLGIAASSFALSGHREFDANLLRAGGAPYTLDQTQIRNGFHLHLVNKQSHPTVFDLSISGPPGATFVIPMAHVELRPLQSADVPFFVSVERSDYRGEAPVRVRVQPRGGAKAGEFVAPFLGPTP